MSCTYMQGLRRFEVFVTTLRFGTFRVPIWARDRASAIATANHKWGVSNAFIKEEIP